MERIERRHAQYLLSRDQPPVASIRPGDRFVVETHDCRTGTIQSEDQLADLPDLRFVNPVTGPIAVTGASPGDILVIAVHSIDVVKRGLMLVRPVVTSFDRITEPALRIATVDGNTISVGGFRVALDPMIGVVGVAPAGAPAKSVLGGPHGGNMDTRLINAGSVVFLTVEVPGASLYVGDVHASQGDGEVFLTGVEIAAEVTASVGLLRGRALPTPMVETPDVLAIIAEGPTLDEASRRALDRALDYLVAVSGLSPIDAGFLLSAACHLRVSQFVPRATIHARVEIPKAVLLQNGWPTSPLVDAPDIVGWSGPQERSRDGCPRGAPGLLQQ